MKFTKRVKINLPQGLILFRLLLAPVILGLAWFMKEPASPAIVLLMYLGLISDILDGIIARKQNCSTEKIRRMDSQTDMIFWLSIGFSAWILYPGLIEGHSTLIWVILCMEIACYVLSWLKFGKETCTHAFLSKLWGISLLIAFTSLIGFKHAGLPFSLAVTLGLISHIDRILITLILPRWTHDVPSVYHAYLIKKGIPFKRNQYLNG